MSAAPTQRRNASTRCGSLAQRGDGENGLTRMETAPSPKDLESKRFPVIGVTRGVAQARRGSLLICPLQVRALASRPRPAPSAPHEICTASEYRSVNALPAKRAHAGSVDGSSGFPAFVPPPGLGA